MPPRISSSSTGRASCPWGKTAGLLAAAVALLAASCGSGEVPVFDGESSFGFIEEQCEIGFRYPGTREHGMLQRYLVDKLEEYGANVSVQPFEAVLSTGDTLDLINIIGNYNKKASVRVLLGAHYDTRPVSDMDPDPANRSTPVLGANDGGSGVAVLLEIARVLHANPPPVGVDIVLFDGEDYGESGRPYDFCLGSKHFASSLKGYRPSAAIIVDMVGDRDLDIKMEGYSSAASPRLLSDLFDIAERLQLSQFKREEYIPIIDDHLPLIQAGIQAVNLIDFDYPYWHTIEDSPDKCSAESLAAVGSVLLEYIWTLK